MSFGVFLRWYDLQLVLLLQVRDHGFQSMWHMLVDAQRTDHDRHEHVTGSACPCLCTPSAPIREGCVQILLVLGLWLSRRVLVLAGACAICVGIFYDTLIDPLCVGFLLHSCWWLLCGCRWLLHFRLLLRLWVCVFVQVLLKRFDGAFAEDSIRSRTNQLLERFSSSMTPQAVMCDSQLLLKCFDCLRADVSILLCSYPQLEPVYGLIAPLSIHIQFLLADSRLLISRAHCGAYGYI